MLGSATHVDGFQMSVNRTTSGGQGCDQETAVQQQTFHLEKSSFFIFEHVGGNTYIDSSKRTDRSPMPRVLGNVVG